jgi:hypothetical protein
MCKTSSNMQRTTTTCNATCSMQHATGNVQHATHNVEFVKDHWQQATRQQETRQHAACSRHRAEDGKTMQRMQQTTCIRQQTTCKRTRAHASCHRKHTASPHFVRGEQRSADNPQHARSIVLDNQCATRHRRHTQDATYDPCRAACSKHTRNRQNAADNAMHGMRRTRTLPPRVEKGREMRRNGISGRSRHLEAARALESRPDTRAPRRCSGVQNGTWRCLRRSSSPTPTYIVGMRASLANAR